MRENTKNALLISAASLGALLVARGVRRRASRIDLHGKVVVITGGSRGLGLEMARRLTRHGARLAICARDAAQLGRARAELAASGADVFAATCDIGDRAQVAAFISAVESHYGAIDVLINNAAVIQVGPAAEMTIADFETSLRTNFWGALYMTLAALPRMRERATGRIVNITSIGGRISVPHLLPYSVGKHAHTALSEGLRAELLRENIYVTTVMPGPLRTGSYVNAEYKGQHEDEYAWFSAGDSVPVLAMDSGRAASQIIDAMREGRAQLVLPLQAALAVKFHAVLPEVSNLVLALMARSLPAPSEDADGKQSRKGYDSDQDEPTITKLLGTPTVEANNEA